MLKGEVSLEGKMPVPAGNGRGDDDKDALFRRGRWRHLHKAHAKGPAAAARRASLVQIEFQELHIKRFMSLTRNLLRPRGPSLW